MCNLQNKYTNSILVDSTLRQAKRISDYVLFMYMGELVEHEPVHRTFTQPTDTWMKEYVEGVIG